MRRNYHGYFAVAVLSLGLASAACHRTPPATLSGAVEKGSPPLGVSVQVVPPDPCAWISRAGAEQSLGDALMDAPTRVLSVENPQPSADGEACHYSLQNADPQRRGISLQVKADESGLLRTSVANKAELEPALQAGPRQTDALLDGRWDFHAAIPGGLTALGRGRIAIILTSSPALADRGALLAAAIVEGIADLPFSLASDDPAVAAGGHNPCTLISLSEAQSVLGPMKMAPYRSRKSTALAYGSGASCTYFTAQHRAVVLTPTWSRAKNLFPMMAGASRLATPAPPGHADTPIPKGSWDQLSYGPDGALVALKDDAMISLQFLTANIDANAAIAPARFCIPRAGAHPLTPITPESNTMMRARAALLILSTLGTLCLAHAASKQNSLIIRIADGPFAGTYTPPGSEVICLHAQAQRVFSAAWKSFQAQKKSNAFTEGGLEVSNPDSPGKKHGDISLTFADPAGHSTNYSISNAPIDYAPHAAGATISFEGSSNSGIRIKISAECVDVTRV